MDTQALVTSVEAVVERVFDAVERLRGHVLDRWNSVITRQEPLRGKDIAGLRDGVLELLAEQRDLVVGMGLIVTPGLLPDEQRRLEWWQYVPGHREPAALRVDLNPDSMGFYEYESADWFAIPRSSGRRHIVGPYVDAHGTDRYLLTFTMPVLAGSEFLGVVGADVPVSRFETRLLRAWGRQDCDVVIVNSDRRVVVSNSARELAGDLSSGVDAGAISLEIPGLPWQLLVAPRMR